MMKVYEQITAMKKAATKREAEKKELADVVEQDKLIEIKGKSHDLISSRTELMYRSSPLRSQECLSPSASRGQKDGRQPGNPCQWSPLQT
jgi:hypothetical protein